MRSPEIRFALSLDGKVRDMTVVSDSPEDRDLLLSRWTILLPAIELLESLMTSPVEPSTPAGKDIDSVKPY
jgi:hypothetical protein